MFDTELEKIPRAGILSEEEKLLLLKQIISKIIEGMKQEKIEIPEEFYVKNFDEVKAHLKNEFAIALKEVRSIISKFKIPDVEVKLPDMPSLTIKENVTIDNLSTLADVITQLQSVLEGMATKIDSIDFNPIFKPEILIPEIKIPRIVVPRIDAPNVTVKAADVNLDEIIKYLKPLSLLSDKPSKYISVRLSDGGKFIKMLQSIAKSQDNIVRTFSTAVGMTVDEYKTVSGVPKTMGHKKVTVAVAGTPVNVSTTTLTCKHAYLSADSDAGIILCVGGDNTVRATVGNKNGMILIPGNDVVKVETNDLKNLWVDAETNGGILCVSYSVL